MKLTKEEAARFFYMYGNVGRTSEELLLVKPTLEQIGAACDRAKLSGQWQVVIDAAQRAILEEE